ncbi:hypothetical protein SAMN05192588_2918 [Nonlabens sp. Hel1_33_55]|uniref:hypothetical protein n=1 Tax=Nonlabens sp. Hel1_33_55 TaxID=1336802 RepID=UPI000875EE34|nr:hypothetical protein [Nonlabens sp. Hel1_33_55]SCY44246.1 hypothetical protein SAMN05192588_2918 [Nonlabens sp. Hel1_33_55]
MNDFFKIALRFVGLLLVQIFVMDQINFLGFINPMIYVLFIFLYPFENNRLAFLLISFGYGLIMDTFQDTGGAHAAACLTLTFFRPYLLKLVYGESYLMKNIKVLSTSLDRVFLFLVIGIFLHHLVFFGLVVFNISQIWVWLKMTFAVGAASVILSMVLLLIIKPKRS